MGIVNKQDENQTRWATGLISHPILESENRVKYILAKNNINPLWYSICDTIGTFGDVKAFRSKYLLPVGYTYSQYIRENTFAALSNTQKDFVSLKAVVINEKDLQKVAGMKEFNLADTIAPTAFSLDIYRNDINELSKDTLVLVRFDDQHVSGTVTVDSRKVMYLTMPYDGGWHLKLDGAPADKLLVNAGMTGILLDKGRHTVELNFGHRYAALGWGMVVAGLVLYIMLLFVVKRKSSPSNESSN